MKCHHPDVFCAAILNAQPMGFYSPAQLVRDARQHGVEVRPIDVNASAWDCTLEPLNQNRSAVRLGLRMTRGLAEKHGLQLVAARGARTFPSILEISRRTHLPVSALVQLAKADAFRSLHLTRREASWAIKALRDNTLPLFDDADRREQRICPELTEPPVTLTTMTKGREVVEDYRSHGLSLRSHPLAFLRKELTAMNIIACAALRDAKNGQRVTVSGLVLVRQMPGSAKGVMFITLEDETDIANLIVWPSQFEKQRRTILAAQMLACRGKVQRASGTIHVIAEHLIDHSEMLRAVGGLDEALTVPAGRGDETKSGDDPGEVSVPMAPGNHISRLRIVEESIAVKARNFR